MECLPKLRFLENQCFILKIMHLKFVFIIYARWLKDKGIGVIDAQVKSEHISQWGGELISRDKFMDIIM
jgi:leucyl/phenylalanyl-tRNA--protein transferase